jgi:hypothetical protein
MYALAKYIRKLSILNPVCAIAQISRACTDRNTPGNRLILRQFLQNLHKSLQAAIV